MPNFHFNSDEIILRYGKFFTVPDIMSQRQSNLFLLENDTIKKTNLKFTC